MKGLMSFLMKALTTISEVTSLSHDNKRITSAKYVSHYENLFACPICKTSMNVIEFKSLMCSNHHTFDFAKQGYLNLTTHPVHTKYSKDLFEARRNLISISGFYQPLIQSISNMIDDRFGKRNETLSILDTGCGEGSHLSAICDLVRSEYAQNAVGVGIDISKEGISVAAKNHPNKIWAVADLANTPFKNNTFDVILNILSPSNYAEFTRLMSPDGFVIKVVPQSGYLKELREHLYLASDKQNYSNSETVERFNENFQFVERYRLTYTMNLNKASLEWLVQMTPLTWSTTEERVHSFSNQDSAQITVDLDLLIGKNVM